MNLSRRNLRRLLPLLGLTALLPLSACLSGQAQEADTAPAANTRTVATAQPTGVTTVAAAQEQPAAQPGRARQVRVVTAETGAVTSRRTASVTIEPAREAQVAAATNGQVRRILVREGTDVAAGDPVIQIDDANLRLQVENARLALETARVSLAAAEQASGEGAAQASAALQAAQANLDLNRRQYEEARELFEAGAVSAAELAGLEAQYAQARSSHQQALDALSRSQRAGSEDLELQRLQVSQAQNQLAQAERALADATVRAPFAGQVAALMVEEGEFIGAGTPAFRLVDNEGQRARFSVPPSDAAPLLAAGMVHIPYGGLTYAAQILNSSDVPGQTRLVELTARIYPSETRIPNGVVTQLPYEVTVAEGVLVPTNALRTSAGRTFVMEVVEGEVFERAVDVIGEGGGQAVVAGLDEGALVVSPLPPDLIGGTAVEIVGENVR